MCSQPSRRSMPSPSAHAEALTSAIVNVAQESYFSFAERCDAGQFDAALEAVGDPAANPAPRWLRADVDFDGAFAGTVAVTLPYPLATDMAAALSGAMPGDDVPESDVLDSTGEFANMVCGVWLTHTCARRRFDLQPPHVRDASAPGTPGDEGTRFVLVNDQPVSVTVSFRPA